MLEAYPDNRLARILLWSFCALILAFLMLPTLVVVPLSFSASDLLEFPPRAYSLRWYENFFGSATWMAGLRTSLILGTLTATLAVPLGLLACISTNRLGGRTALAIQGALLTPSIVPGILLAIGLFFVLAAQRLVGTLFGVLVGHVVLAIPVACIVLLPALARFDWNQVQAARSLGANWARAIGGIIVPQLQISLLSATLMAFLTSLDESVISIFVASGQNSTLPKLMFLSLRDQIDPTIAAISTLWTVIVLVAVLIVSLRQKS
ncbi:MULTISPECIES: ABC transporter permease [Mesorhizobium]|uniref:Binding-protein-dependent transport systems inner membrane component n=2 Tax=Mesorhizobium opportunistum TaxID=593909 RepID=F7Y4K6_MESOW|nr:MULTISPECIES: ABC transporter permease [Mesorhizobium]TIN91715.1 MAG: ABC transporter permease [Mesorhizobium sp.]AEH87326.1 binding-protein-dependent transport systems inner membrane component [Mesorhizobium opportunistum WSM2075]MCA0030394.1 ABC transporter permease [Mesorhizobium sp. B263B2A]TJU94656.1 MAG: ABC transporter permease [Mesorhizobium sp.]TPN50274.1 ABC transporter permease [Mesorhizobium sp. B1-1-9]